MYTSIGIYDSQAILSTLEAVAWAALLGIGLFLLLKKKPLSKRNQQIIWVIFAVWTIASVGMAGIKTYTYFHAERSSYVQLIDSQKQNGKYPL
jgi:hypothetical protein